MFAPYQAYVLSIVDNYFNITIQTDSHVIT